jgi:hypothetical protein
MKKNLNPNVRRMRRIMVAGVAASALAVPATALAGPHAGYPVNGSHQAKATTTSHESGSGAAIVLLLTITTAGVAVGAGKLQIRRSVPTT